MEAQPDKDQLRARWLLHHGLVTEDELRILRAQLARRPGLNMTRLVVERGILDETRAAQLEQQLVLELARRSSDRLAAVPGSGSGVTDSAPAASSRPVWPPAPSASGHSSDASWQGSASSQGTWRTGSGSGSREIDQARAAIEKYEIVRELNRGANGVIALARHRELGNEVALKILISERPNEEELLRFEREARVLARIQHPNIVRGLDFSRNKGTPYFAMDFIHGRDLQTIVDESLKLQGEPPPREWILKIFADLARALAHCHSLGVIHRDLKPANVLVEDGTERPVLVDFGLMKRDPVEAQRDGDTGDLSKTGDLLGTPAFMSPEQIDYKGRFGPVCETSDVWGLVASMAFCLTGRLPVPGTNAVEVMKRIVREPVPRLSQYGQDVPVWLDELVAECLDRSPDRRPTMTELAGRLSNPPTDALSLSTSASAERSRPRRSAPGRDLRLVAMFAVVVMATLTIAVVAAMKGLGGGPPVTLTSYEGPEAAVATPEVRISGRVSRIPARVTIGRMTIQCVDEADWTHELTLADEGENVVRILIEGDGTEPTVVEKTIVLDRRVPLVELDGGGELIVLPERPVLTGLLRDATPREIQVGERRVETRPDGRFAIEIPDKDSWQTLEVTGRDEAGNVAKRAALVITPKALRLVRTTWLLEDAGRWRTTPAPLQDAVIALVDQALGPRFEHLETIVAKCVTNSNRIAAFRNTGTGLIFHLVPGGTMEMGSEDNMLTLVALRLLDRQFKQRWLEYETPRHEVTVPPFLLGRCEVRQRIWDAVGGADERKHRGDDLPIHGTSWQAVRAWVKTAGDGLRLPSESEWEYACRAGTEGLFFWLEDTARKGWVWTRETSAGKPVAVAGPPTAANAFGLLHTSGNVYEWCEDHFKDSYEGVPSNGAPWTGGEPDDRRVRRGGSWKLSAARARSASRGAASPDKVYEDTGFRVARSLPAELLSKP